MVFGKLIFSVPFSSLAATLDGFTWTGRSIAKDFDLLLHIAGVFVPIFPSHFLLSADEQPLRFRAELNFVGTGPTHIRDHGQLIIGFFDFDWNGTQQLRFGTKPVF